MMSQWDAHTQFATVQMMVESDSDGNRRVRTSTTT